MIRFFFMVVGLVLAPTSKQMSKQQQHTKCHLQQLDLLVLLLKKKEKRRQ
jgi:hypothetical protein